VSPPPRPTPRRIDGVPEPLVHAYRDGELSRLARWRFERRLRRSSALRRALAEIERTGAWVRAGRTEVPGPDLWEAVARRLPASDAERGQSRLSSGLGRLAWPAAVVAAAGAAAAIVLGWPARWESAPGGVVRWIDSGGRDVIVLESDPDTTIIWVLGSPGPEAARGGAGAGEQV
jgi:hypothetical protein